MNENFNKWAKTKKWKIVEQQKSLPVQILERYKNIPKSWLEFIDGYGAVLNENGTVWLLTADNFYPKREDEFRYNEFELISLDAADDDDEWKDDIKAFWDNHLPIVMSVKDGYEYFAVELDSGNIVSGFEPEFEETEVIAEDFDDFLNMVMNDEIF